MFIGLKAKLYAIGAAILLGLMAALKIVTMQRDAAQEDARRAKKHLDERKKIVKAEKEINTQMKEEKAKAVEAIKRGEVPDNIRNRNDF
jgi:uncharacterized protein YqfA (UPF0365 family)